MPLYVTMCAGYLISGAPGAQRWSMTGSCAIYQQRHVLLSAAHCVPADVELYAVLPGDESSRRVHTVIPHPTIDLAVLLADAREPEPLPTQVFTDIDDGLDEGGDFLALGYPMDGEAGPTGRLLKGHFQRYMQHTDSDGRTYFAGEMSIPAPGGLSGGPVVRRSRTASLCAIVTRNVESYSVLDYVEEQEKDGSKLRLEARRVVQYGLAAMLTAQQDWIAQAVATGQPASEAGAPRWRKVEPVFGSGEDESAPVLRRYL